MATNLEDTIQTEQGTQTLEIPSQGQDYCSYPIKRRISLKFGDIILLAWTGAIIGAVGYNLGYKIWNLWGN